jgi:uncharacterized protein
MILPISLTGAGLAALINLWLGIRCGQARTKAKVSVGDGGDEPLMRRMRAHSNFTENAPIVLVLLALVEAAVGTSIWLWVAMVLFMLSRIAHGIGMDGDSKARGVGVSVSMIVSLALGVYALAIPQLAKGKVEAPATDTSTVETVPAE